MSKDGPTAVAVGVFDGVHLGHQHLISRLAEAAAERSLIPTAVIVHPPPRTVLGDLEEWSFLTHPDYRAELLHQYGAENVVTLNFSRQVSLIKARDFSKALANDLDMRFLVAGPDFALGHDREGSIPCLAEIGRSLGFEVQLIESFQLPGSSVSSSAIRVALERRHIREANAMIGRRFEINGEVVEGERRGRLLGFPTANILPNQRQHMPCDGVYAVIARHDGHYYGGVANLGVRPTFGGRNRILEVHLFDFEVDIYGKRLDVAFVDSLRPERRFDGIEELRRQIANDVRAAHQILSDHSAV